MLEDKVPAPFAPRPIQTRILSEIESCVGSGYTNIVLCAPTGVGKSLVGVTVARHFGGSFVVTASKNLQNQYVGDFAFLSPVKGKSNFACHQIMSEQKMDDEVYAARNGMTCEKGRCVTKKTVDGKQIVDTCRFKPTIKQVDEDDCPSEPCPYYVQKYRGLLSPHSLWNYSSYFQIIKFGQSLFGQYLERPVSIFDEAHTLEDQIVQFIGYDIRQRHLEEAEIHADRYDLGSVEDTLEIITEIAKYYSGRIRDVEESVSPESLPDFRILSRLRSIYEEAAHARQEISSDMGNFVVNRPETDADGNIRTISVKPIDVSGFAGEFFTSKHNLFMSATIDKPSFCENMGLDPDSVAIVDAPESPFPLEHRTVEMLRVRHLNYRSTPADEAAVISKIDELMDRHADARGLVLTSSVSKCYYILKGLSERNRRRVKICHSTNPDGRTQGEIIAEHRDEPRSVLLSSSLWEGVDLKDDMSRFQIIAKVPYPNYSEERTRAKMRKFPRWYASRTLTKLLQGLGRSVRSEQDWARTYILDAAADRLLAQSRNSVPLSYRDMLGMQAGSA
ncbi:MAG: ATP-dependent DNA helicase [Thaumarchaeota archaeon]|nr:ATP-dependent DNA helicase [Nitrososphaerota archaeon]